MSRPNLDRLEALPVIGDPARHRWSHRLRQLKYSLAERLWLYRQSRNPLPAILVYQMGKVGSRTVYRTLMSLGLPNPIYHVHWLSPAGIEAEEARYRQAGAKVDRHLRESRSLRRQIERQPQREWWIITLVRDPVARRISELFEQIWMFHPEWMARDGTTRADAALAELEASFASYDARSDKCHTWFESELKQVFGIDIFAHAFDQEAGHGLIERGQVRLLVLRLEDLDRNAGMIGQFVNHSDPVMLIKANIAENKHYAEAYRAVNAALKLPPPLCRQIYGSRYARYFYTPEMRAAFVQRWSQGEAER